MNKISIIVPIYNSEKYLKRCLDSIVKQTYNNLEIILVDDGSNDNSLRIMKEYQTRDKRIKLIEKSNTGVSSSRNVGLINSTGKYITFIDSDDTIDIYYLERVMKCFLDPEIDIVCTNYNYDYNGKIKQNRSFISKKMSNTIALDPMSDYYITSVWGKVFKSKIIKTLKFDEKIFYSEDTLFYTEALLRAKYVFFLNEFLYNYFVNCNGAMQNKNLRKYSTDLVARKKIFDIYQTSNLSKKLINGAKIYLLHSYVNIVFLAKKQGDDLQLDFDKSIVLNWQLVLFFLISRFIRIRDKIKLLYIIIRRW